MIEKTITHCRSKLSLAHFDLLLHNAMKTYCENCRSIAYCMVKLQAVKLDELDVCGSLV